MVKLLSNAAKFSQSGGQVDLALTLQDERYSISERDYGQGILPEMKEKVFEIFTQGDNSDTRTPSGAGFGLSISKSIVERHGGKLDFESIYGESTIFFYELPVNGQAAFSKFRLIFSIDSNASVSIARTIFSVIDFGIAGLLSVRVNFVRPAIDSTS